MAEKKMTIKDVARESGVSIATVSRFLNGNFSSMSKDTKERIEEVIDTLHYQPNKLAQGLKGQSRTIAVVVVNMSYPYCVSVIRSISDVLNTDGYSLLVCETGGDAEKEQTLIRSLVAQGVDGMILQTSGGSNEMLETLAPQMPIVLVDRQFDIPGVKNVITDNENASYKLTEALFAEGYERIYFISEPLEGLSTRIERHDGYLRACEALQKVPHVCWVNRDIPSSLQPISQTIKQDHERDPRPFAIYASNGLLMLQLYPQLTSLPFVIPEQMGIATYDEPSWVVITQPMLTCVRQPTERIGQFAANTVLERLRGDIKPHLQPDVQVLPSELVLSGSTQRMKK